MTIETLRRAITTHIRVLSYSAGSVFVIMWTLLRFFNQRTIFDLVSQQVIVQQWLHGTMTSAHMGITAYVPKMLLLYMPLDLLPGSPRLKLIALTVVINVATFILLGIALEKILAEFKVKPTKLFYGALVWLGAIAGSVFWIEFTNSRNLEVAGGVFLLYMGLRFLREPTWKWGTGIAAFSGLLFFADMLQLYMTALPLLGYAAVLSARRLYQWRVVLQLLMAVAGGFVVSKLLFLLSQHLLLLSFAEPHNAIASQLSQAWLLESGKGLVKSFVVVFEGGKDAGRLREYVNIALLAFILSGGVFAALKKRVSNKLFLLISIILGVNIVVYVASGQAVQADTSRYLIMTAPAVILIAALVQYHRMKRTYVLVGFAAVLIGNFVALGGALAQNWDTNFPKDAHLASVHTYMLAHPGATSYASTDTAISAQYLYRLPAKQLLPLGCLNGSLVKTHYSMDTAFAETAKQSNTPVALIFDTNVITNTPNVCTPASVMAQLGQPMGSETTSDGSLVLLYPKAISLGTGE
ncbi:MAG: hypothetical protein JWL89_516 [Candidatus Saccharibacteria bacterium]|nr:hypothetical protein [Candidatus Saccharibacteria bacterium]